MGLSYELSCPTVFVLNMKGCFLNKTGFVLNMTGSVLNNRGFVLNMTGFIKKKYIYLKYDLSCHKYD